MWVLVALFAVGLAWWAADSGSGDGGAVLMGLAAFLFVISV